MKVTRLFVLYCFRRSTELCSGRYCVLVVVTWIFLLLLGCSVYSGPGERVGLWVCPTGRAVGMPPVAL